MTLHDSDGARSQSVLAPIRAGLPAPIFEKVGSAPDMLTLTHAADAVMATAPRRLSIRGTLLSDFHPGLLVEVWRMWEAFSGSGDVVRSTSISWDMKSFKDPRSPGKDTALSQRTSYYWVAVQERYAGFADRIIHRAHAVGIGPRRTRMFKHAKNSRLKLSNSCARIWIPLGITWTCFLAWLKGMSVLRMCGGELPTFAKGQGEVRLEQGRHHRAAV